MQVLPNRRQRNREGAVQEDLLGGPWHSAVGGGAQMQRGLPIERDVRKVSMNLRTRVGRKGWRRTLSVVTPEVAMMIDTSLNVEDDSLVAGIVSFLLSFFPSTSLVGSLFTVNDGGRCNEVGVAQRSGENECTFLSSVRGAGVTQVSRRAV